MTDTIMCSKCVEHVWEDALVTLPCEHHFHELCLDEELQEQETSVPTCPACASEIDSSWLDEYYCEDEEEDEDKEEEEEGFNFKCDSEWIEDDKDDNDYFRDEEDEWMPYESESEDMDTSE